MNLFMMRKTKYDEHSGNYETSPNDAEKMEEAQEKLAQQEITGTQRWRFGQNNPER